MVHSNGMAKNVHKLTPGKRSPHGRRYKNPRVFCEKLFDLSKKGTPRELLGPLLTLPTDVVLKWIDTYPSLKNAVEQGEAEYVAELMKRISERDKGWQALTWLLSHRFPRHFGDTNSQSNDSATRPTKYVDVTRLAGMLRANPGLRDQTKAKMRLMPPARLETPLANRGSETTSHNATHANGLHNVTHANGHEDISTANSDSEDAA